ncbi:MAG: DNA polymerase III subunit gamma/tau [Spirochaetales bacterium]|nr:DNA polymerase III subunit gamma/tau [Spirochaetales bacterium]
MSYEITATRKRPSSFETLSGQEFVVATLKNSIQSGHIAHAYLFAGPRGVGKTSAARILAKSLNCLKEKGPAAEPCGICENCVEISRGISPDVIEIDGASNNSVNDVRQIKDEVLFAPGGGRYKVYIIDEVHMLSSSAFNALLKTIEEPPPYIVFIFATTEIQKVPATIRSRCQQFNFRRISIETSRNLLKKLCDEMSITAEDDALLWIAKEATGSLRDAYTLFDQVVSFSGNSITIRKILDKLGFAGLDRMNELGEFLADGKSKESFLFVDELLSSGVSPEQFVADMTEYFRNILWLKNGIRKEAILGYSAEAFSKKVIEAFQPYQIEKALALLFELYRNLRYSLNQRFEIELALARLADLKNYITPRQITERVLALRKELKNGFVVHSAEDSPATPAGTEVPAGASGDTESDTGQPAEQAEAPRQAEQTEQVGGFMSAAKEAEVSGEVPMDKRTAIIQNIRKKKLTLGSNLEKAGLWRVTGDTLHLFFDTKFAADFVIGDLASVAQQIEQVLGRKLKIEVKVNRDETAEETKEKEDAAVDEQVKMVQKVFRGEIIK